MSDHPDPSRFELRATHAGHRAFTMIELTVVIGAVLVLIGLLLPTLSKTMSRARLTRMTASLHSSSAALHMYARDFDDLFPVANEALWAASREWFRSLISAGLMDQAADADPEGWRLYDTVRVHLSMCMLQRAEQMQPGNTVAPEDARSVPVKHRQVLFPSSKGVLVQRYGVPTVPHEHWCCVPGQDPKPVAMADGAVLQGRWQDFTLEDELYIENGIGRPVISTWGGYEARDR